MPSNFTPNYKLNQWEAEDRVLRVDFNADNAKLDAALGALEGKKADKTAVAALTARADAQAAGQCMFRLLDHKVPRDTEALDLDLSGLDLGQYALVKLMLYVQIPITSTTLRMRFNGLTGGYWTGGMYPDTTEHITLFGNSYHGRLVHMNLWGDGTDNTWLAYDMVCPDPNDRNAYTRMGACRDITLSKLTSLNFFYTENRGSYIPAGSWFRMFGIK